MKKSKHPLYGTYHGMIRRCYVTTAADYKNYGGRGIKVCKRWRERFEAFATDMGPKPTREHSLDRRDNNGDYCPDNCRWATPRKQQNNRRDNRVVKVDGEEKTIANLARELGVDYNTLWTRLKSMPVDEALNIPDELKIYMDKTEEPEKDLVDLFENPSWGEVADVPGYY